MKDKQRRGRNEFAKSHILRQKAFIFMPLSASHQHRSTHGSLGKHP